VILADTSAWIEYLRATESASDHELTRVIGTPELRTTEPIVMEVLAGALPHELDSLRVALLQPDPIPVLPGDWEVAASIYRTCRQAGTTPRKVLDCLIAAVAIRADASVLHHDRGFEAIARHTPLQLVDV
jgi:predicted nucleic acid-binding protein